MKKNKKKLIIICLVVIIMMILQGCTNKNSTDEVLLENSNITIAVEYNTHAAPAFIAQEMKWIPEDSTFNIYATGMALASAFTRGEVDAGYICLVPAITAYANGGVPIKIICGTHKYGYGIVSDLSKVSNAKDLEKEGVKIACVKEGGAADVLFNKMIEVYGLDKEKILKNVVRMNPSKQIIALKMGKVDVVVVPEHFASLAEKIQGCEMIVKSQEVWPDMQGSVLVVTDELINENLEMVKYLYETSIKAEDYISENLDLAAEIVTNKINIFNDEMEGLDGKNNDLIVDNELIFQSMNNLIYTINIDEKEVQNVIDFMYKLGYINKRFLASDIMFDVQKNLGE